MQSILFLLAHPNLAKSRANRAIASAVRDLPFVTFVDLYEEYPDFFIDTNREQARLLAHDTLVFQHPFYWYSMPPLLKQWEDDVLELGFAYGSGGNKLHGKKFLLSITAGGPQDAYRPGGYNNFEIDTLITPYRQTSHLCGWEWLAPIVLHSSLRASDEALRSHAQTVRSRLEMIANSREAK